jgi:hypothetical protein
MVGGKVAVSLCEAESRFSGVFSELNARTCERMHDSDSRQIKQEKFAIETISLLGV